jgi:hypothetical protein
MRINQSASFVNVVANRGAMHTLKQQYPLADGSVAGYAPFYNYYYVDVTNGIDTNDGSQPNKALKTLTKAVALATQIGLPNTCIVLAPSTTAYSASETFPIAIPAALDNLTIMSASAIPGWVGHTVVGASATGSTSGLIYVWADNFRMVNVSMLSNKTCLYVGTETTHGGGVNTVVPGCLLEGCKFDTAATASAPALIMSCTNGVVKDCVLSAGGTTSDCAIIYDPAIFIGCRFEALVNGLHVAGSATNPIIIRDCDFVNYTGTTAATGPFINLAVGSSQVFVTGCTFGDDSEGDSTNSIAAVTTYTGLITLADNVHGGDVANPADGAGDKTATTAALVIVKVS